MNGKKVILLMLLLIILSSAFCTNVTLHNGKIYLVNLSDNSATSKWFGFIIHHGSTPSSLVGLNSPRVYTITLLNYKYAIFVPSYLNFNGELTSVSASDLLENHIFSKEHFPVFYPDFYSTDGPNSTFYGDYVLLDIWGNKIYTFKIKVNSADEYLAKYNNSPIFITDGDYVILPFNQTYSVYYVFNEGGTSSSTTKSSSNPPSFAGGSFPPMNLQQPTFNYTSFNITIQGIYNKRVFVLYKNSPFKGAVVKLYENGDLISQKKTNSKGSALFNLTSNGNYTIKVFYGNKLLKNFVFEYVGYHLKVIPKVASTKSKVCVYLFNLNSPSSGNINIIFPNGKSETYFVNTHRCFEFQELGLYTVIYAGSKTTFLVNMFVPPQTAILPNTGGSGIKVSYVIEALIFVFVVAFIIIPFARYYWLKKEHDVLFKRMLRRR